MHNQDVVFMLAGGLAVALAFGYATNRLGLSPIVGYLLAGAVVGPHTPGFVVDQGLADQLAEVGVVLLMFGVGLHFRLDELLAVRRVALPGALAQCGAATAFGTAVALAFGWSPPAAVVFGISVSFASTVVLTRVLSDQNQLHTPTGHVAVGWLILQDVFAVLVLVVLPAVLKDGPVDAVELPLALGLAALKVGVLIAAVLLAGGYFVPRLLKHVAETRSRELFTLTVLVVALGIAVGSAVLFGASMALGAFLAGMVVGRSEFSVRAATEALPMRDAFAVLFFISVGMLFEPAFLLKAPGLVAATAAIVMIATPVTTFALVLARGYPVRVALGVGLALAQIGEFSFIVAAAGKSLNVLPEAATQVLVVVAIGTISVSPLVYRLAGLLERWAAGRPRLWALLTARTRERLGSGPEPVPANAEPAYRAVVVGYGPVGRTVCRLLRENGIEPTVVELNVDTVKQLRAEGVRAVYGDATHPNTLKEAGADRAASLILSSSQVSGGSEVIRAAKELNPGIRVLARSAYVRELAALQRAGSEVVVSGEGEVALALTEAILRRLGATPDQIDRERERVRLELSAGGAEVYSRNADTSPDLLLPDAPRKN
ncbi:Inner membrane protein YbaL [Gemmata obscuriglobus]|uniref:Sodium:proton exchanger n=1 Tax=Gemmata obscuriglobus TaxID=114 RepID=A0A2Z3H3G3_9BACT|nr:cation:proton antiporter [Gemmata obscuriglobus]AWM37645.1 sodium:proton exchanger [Gemmata obscuriglobus]QEG29558.1 Inner membrane protein YbaL [Gemmata obscuriglobus]VTS08795.1 sodium hydrogen exchanger : Monovalent cation/proton antiporter family protein OS=Geobacter sulfurreducens (strain ATCC 51573 / DSM 12127 / PCA) GN=GSU0261 PE=4 SV=1: Na_H_Exchanger: TrkA_N [Gemmata obscuriglobus UQM 2246]